MRRRAFLSGLLAVPAGGLLRGRAVASSSLHYRSSGDAIEVCRRTIEGWRVVQRVRSRNPVALLHQADQGYLFAANAIGEFEGLPTGSVESYAVEASGRLRFVSRQPLSLAATYPGEVALAPGGRHLMVHSPATGIVSLLPLSADGSVGRVSHALKLIGANEGLKSVAFEGGQLRRLYNQQP
jgi:6-phosphogluconolactonase (cycloisomerase 2 family)